MTGTKLGCSDTNTSPDPWSIKLEVNPGNYDDGPGISLLVPKATCERGVKRLVKATSYKLQAASLKLDSWSGI